jgi:hypothetical protein
MVRKILFILILAAVVVAIFLNNGVIKAATNINSTNRWAWSDLSGWWDFYVENTVEVTSYKLTGYASSSIEDISLDCATTRNGNICGTSEYGVCNGTQYEHQNGTCQKSESTLRNLSGFAWNDAIGWISFCGGNGTNQCPGSISYGVTIDSNGDFQGYAWNDIEGWVSFNCINHGGCDISYKVNTNWQSIGAIGYLESSIFDTQTKGTLNSIIWQGSQPSGTCVNFQIAVSNSQSGPWAYYGPGQNSNAYFGASCPGPNSPIVIGGSDRVWISNKQYLRYKAQLQSDVFRSQTPTVTNIILNWSP